MEKKKLSDFERNKENPFIATAVSEMSIIRRTQTVKSKDETTRLMIVNENTAEVEGYSCFVKFVEVDEEKFAKVYLSQFSALWELTKPGIRVLGYILNLIKPNKDTFIFRIDQCMEETKYKNKKQVYEGLANLLEYNIIARSKYDDEYYINPLIVFNGNRVVFAKAYVKKRKETNQENLKNTTKESSDLSSISPPPPPEDGGSGFS